MFKGIFLAKIRLQLFSLNHSCSLVFTSKVFVAILLMFLKNLNTGRTQQTRLGQCFGSKFYLVNTMEPIKNEI